MSICSLFLSPDDSLLFLSLSITVGLLWHQRLWPAALMTMATLGLGFYLKRINIIAISSLASLALGLYFYYTARPKIQRIAFFILTPVIALFYMHKIPGFYNLKIIDAFQISIDSLPYTAYLNLDKTLAGLFLFSMLPHIRTFIEWKKAFSTALILSLPLAAILMATAFSVHYVRLDLKLPPFTLLWMVMNLLFVCMAEEAFFRGFVLKEIEKFCSTTRLKRALPISASALLFGAAHFPGGPIYMILASIAGFFYGYAYLKTRRLEAAILTHFFINLIHFIGFTYPALK